jgi:hypothetical protein
MPPSCRFDPPVIRVQAGMRLPLEVAPLILEERRGRELRRYSGEVDERGGLATNVLEVGPRSKGRRACFGMKSMRVPYL